jgi:hypothetical protein
MIVVVDDPNSMRIVVFGQDKNNPNMGIEPIYVSPKRFKDLERRRREYNAYIMMITEELAYNKFFTPQGLQYFIDGLDNNWRCMFGKPLIPLVIPYFAGQSEPAIVDSIHFYNNGRDIYDYTMYRYYTHHGIYYALMNDNCFKSIIAKQEENGDISIISAKNKKASHRMIMTILKDPERIKMGWDSYKLDEYKPLFIQYLNMFNNAMGQA